MAWKAEGDSHYGENQADLREELAGYSRANGYVVHHSADAVCGCGGKRFRLALDDGAGVAVRTCSECGMTHAIGDSAEYMDDAAL